MALTKEEVLTALRCCLDPEIPINIVDLGLIYSVELNPSRLCAEQWEIVVQMTLTSSGCPMSQSITHEMQKRLLALSGVRQVKVEIVWEPLWSPERISPEGRRLLQLN
jgi:metal-sulfur cluster biosynthetic enzyme